MRLKPASLALCGLVPTFSGLRIEVAGGEDLSALSTSNDASQPVMQSFANHLHSVASLFSSIVNKGGLANQYNSPGCYSPETEDSEFPAWSGPYCLISYSTEKSCSEEFNCNFSPAFDIKLPNDAKLCCRGSQEPWSSKFEDKSDGEAKRVFSRLNNVDNLPENAKQEAGHYGLAEVIFNERVRPEQPLYINKFDMGAACKMWGEEYGYYSLNPVPKDSDSYSTSQADTELAVCAMARKLGVSEVAKEIPSIMPFCTFKIQGQQCPEYAQPHLTFPKSVVSLPNDALYRANTFIDSSGFCCSLTQHKTVDKTTVNLDYLPANWTMNDFQVIRWPYAECPEFEFPRMKLTEHQIEFSGRSDYPWQHADLKFSMCSYTQPEPVEEVEEVEIDQTVDDEDFVPVEIPDAKQSEVSVSEPDFEGESSGAVTEENRHGGEEPPTPKALEDPEFLPIANDS